MGGGGGEGSVLKTSLKAWARRAVRERERGAGGGGKRERGAGGGGGEGRKGRALTESERKRIPD